MNLSPQFFDKFPHIPTPEPDLPEWFEPDFDEMDEF